MLLLIPPPQLLLLLLPTLLLFALLRVSAADSAVFVPVSIAVAVLDGLGALAAAAVIAVV